jgi:hypothetical protein
MKRFLLAALLAVPLTLLCQSPAHAWWKECVIPVHITGNGIGILKYPGCMRNCPTYGMVPGFVALQAQGHFQPPPPPANNPAMGYIMTTPYAMQPAYSHPSYPAYYASPTFYEYPQATSYAYRR